MDMWKFLGTGYTEQPHGRRVVSPISAYGRGIISTFLPIEPVETGPTTQQFYQREKDIQAFLRDPQNRPGFKLTTYEKYTSASFRKLARPVGKTAFAAFGPAMLGYRLSTESSQIAQQQGLGAGLSSAVRIVGEEAASGAGIAAGMAIGGKIGLAAGSVVPGIGNIAGFVAGSIIGVGIGAAGGAVWNKMVDVGELPFTVARYLGEQGRQSVKLELGGGISRGNRSRIAHTMRQRALMQMNNSGINARSLLGREAALMHKRI